MTLTLNPWQSICRGLRRGYPRRKPLSILFVRQHLAHGQPRLVPICFALLGSNEGPSRLMLYSSLDEKPKRGNDVRALARVRDIQERPEVMLLFERWSEDWSNLAWLRARGIAALLEPGENVEAHRNAVRALRRRYPQYEEQAIDTLPMIAVEITEATMWSAA